MPRHPKVAEKSLPTQTLVIDNGAYTIKAGFASAEATFNDCQVIPNCIAKDRGKRVWVGAQLDKCNDFGELAFRRPVEKGFLVNWEAEKAIWDQSFIDAGAKLKCDPHETNLILTEAPNAPTVLQTNCDQVVFEEYEFASYSRCVGTSLNAYLDIPQLFGADASSSNADAAPVECLLVIDSGFSNTTVTPLFHGKPIQQAVRRLDVGGKFLTNYLKELVSIRHYNMLDETHLINEVKEAVCFVSSDFNRDLDLTHKGSLRDRRKGTDKEILIDYVLPDYNANKHGYVRAHDPSVSAKMKKIGSLLGAGDVAEDFMTLGNERFTVPELLFNPSDVGLKQPGLPETVMSSLSSIPTGLWPAMLANTLVVGGNANIEGFIERLEADVRQLAPIECKLRLVKAADPIRSTWFGGCRLASNKNILKTKQITRQEYQENGGAWLARVFSGAELR